MSEQKNKKNNIEDFILKAIEGSLWPITRLKKQSTPATRRVLIMLLEMDHQLSSALMSTAVRLMEEYGKQLVCCLEGSVKETGALEKGILAYAGDDDYRKKIGELSREANRKKINVVSAGVGTTNNETERDFHNRVMVHTLCHFTTESIVICINRISCHKDLERLIRESGNFSTIIQVMFIPYPERIIEFSSDSKYLKITGNSETTISSGVLGRLMMEIRRLMPVTSQQEEKKRKRSYSEFAFHKSPRNPEEDAFFREIEAGNMSYVKEALHKNKKLITSINSAGNSPLHAAIWANQGIIIEFLVGAGVDLRQKDIQGQTPAELANYIGKYWPCSFSTSSETYLKKAIANLHQAQFGEEDFSEGLLPAPTNL
jgi:hypothetical protein